jgi:hypothetical protein
MLQFTEKIPPLRRPEIFDEFVKVDPAFGRQEDSQRQVEEDHWVKDIIANLAGFLRKTGK